MREIKPVGVGYEKAGVVGGPGMSVHMCSCAYMGSSVDPGSVTRGIRTILSLYTVPSSSSLMLTVVHTPYVLQNHVTNERRDRKRMGREGQDFPSFRD